MRLALAVATALALPCTVLAAPHPNDAQPLCVEHVGDDGLSERWAEAVEKAFAGSSRFRQACGRADALEVMASTMNVAPRSSGRFEFTYQMSQPGRRPETGKRTCSEAGMASCATALVSRASRYIDMPRGGAR